MTDSIIGRFLKRLSGSDTKKETKGTNSAKEDGSAKPIISTFSPRGGGANVGRVSKKSNIFTEHKKYIAERSTTYVAPKFVPMPTDLKSNETKKEIKLEKPKNQNNNEQVITSIKDAIKLRGKTTEKNVDLPYWSERIERVSAQYKFPHEFLTAITSTESNFVKNIDHENGRGPMGITTIAVKAFFPDVSGNWYETYKQMNEPLLNDILYKKDSAGNFIKDANGNFVLKYKTPEELRNACAKDDEFGIKVGLLSFQMQYVCAVAQKCFEGKTWKTAPKAITAMKEGSLKLSTNDNKQCVQTALKNYNSVFVSYAPEIMKYLEHSGVNFDHLYIT